MTLIFLNNKEDSITVKEEMEDVLGKIDVCCKYSSHPFISLTLYESYYDGDDNLYYDSEVLVNYKHIDYMKP